MPVSTKLKLAHTRLFWKLLVQKIFQRLKFGNLSIVIHVCNFQFYKLLQVMEHLQLLILSFCARIHYYDTILGFIKSNQETHTLRFIVCLLISFRHLLFNKNAPQFWQIADAENFKIPNLLVLTTEMVWTRFRYCYSDIFCVTKIQCSHVMIWIQQANLDSVSCMSCQISHYI